MKNINEEDESEDVAVDVVSSMPKRCKKATYKPFKKKKIIGTKK